jgi:hypothetical protein
MLRSLKRWLDWRRWLVYVHRWLGIAGGVLFVAWFVSGMVMMYARMPGMANEERLARASTLDLDSVSVSPLEAARAAGLAPHDEALAEAVRAAGDNTAPRQAGIGVDLLRIGMLDDRPVYRFGSARRRGAFAGAQIVFADTGEVLTHVGRAEAESIARRYAPGYDGPFHYDGYLTGPDQWTLQARGQMPMHRFALDDADDTRLYVSSLTGDVVLRTTWSERFWGYLGPVTHWVYFTPLRRHGSVWLEFIIWSSLLGCVMCLTGLVWGIWRYSPIRRFRLRKRKVPVPSPYVGLMKWHHYTGLFFGVITFTWAYSGLLSVGPFDWFQSPGVSREQREVFTGGPLRVDRLALDDLRAAAAEIEKAFGAAGSLKELEVVQVRGEPYWLAYRAPTNEEAAQWMQVGLMPRAPRPVLERRYVSATRPKTGTFAAFEERHLGDESLVELARAAMPGVPVQDAVWLHEFDDHYYDSRGTRSLPVLRVRYLDPDATWLYLDPARGGIALKTDDARRQLRWLYQGLHSLDFPFLYYERPLWDVVVIVLSIGGTVVSATTLVPAWRRLRRHAAKVGRKRRRASVFRQRSGSPEGEPRGAGRSA